MTIQAVPNYDQVKSFDMMSTAQLNILVAIIYISTLLYVFELLVALYNIKAFLIKQRKYKTVPLLLFYILTVWLCIMRIYYSVWYFSIWIDAEILGGSLKNVLKINIGLV